jgi:outer membrane protein OmpA-like peptidoglycan-associated protein
LRTKILLTLLILTLQTACAINLQSLVGREGELRVRDDFNGYLAREYLQYSRDLANRYNWRDSDYFAQKGIRSADNREIYPEVPENWDVDSSKLEEVVISRKRLHLLLNPRVKQQLPIQLAHLTMLYDCWLSNEQKPWSLGGLSRCKTRFLRLSNEIEKHMSGLKTKKKVKIIQVKEPEFKKFDVYFDFNSYKFNSNANKEFFDLIEYLEKLNGDFRIMLSGNADRRGKKIYNDNLARRRVLVTKNMLVKNGVPSDLIEIESNGERSPRIITKDNRRNKHNRLVGVYVLKGNDSLSPIPLPLIDNYIYKKEIRNMKKNKGLKG